MFLPSQVGAVAMARAGRPASESYMPVCYSGSQSLSFSSDAGTAGTEDEDDRAPIFSLSKSSMDVVMATGLPHKRDPAWNISDLKRSSSTNTPSEQTSLAHKPLHPHMWQHLKPTNSHQLSLSAQNIEAHNPPAAVSERIINMQRWSQCSGSTHSRSSTPDTIVWKGGTSRPSSLTQETPYSPAPESPVPTPTTISPNISPLQTPTLPPEDLLTTSSSFLILNTHQRNDLLVSSSPLPSPMLPPLQPHTFSPLPSNSPNLNQRTSTDDEGFLENNLLAFTFPSPIPSSVSLAEGGASPDPGSLVDDVIEKLHSPGSMQLSESGEVRSPAKTSSFLTLNSPAKRQESGASVCYLELPWQPEQSCATGRSWKSPLVSSLSDSQLGDCCKCNLNTRGGINKVEMLREEGTMTSQLELVDAAVQTITPVGSLWGLRMNASNSNMGSHSILGSPPGSRLNLKSSVGSHSNLVSPSSSMFPVSSGEEEERCGETWNSPQEPDSRRSCLKSQGEDRDELGRRSSMKQVQWDEDGMTWDIHGASLDPEVLSTAILKHLEDQNSPQPVRRTSKKKKAPKPPVISNVVKAMTPELNPPAMIITATCVAEAESKDTPDEEGEKEEEGKKEEIVEAAGRISRAEADTAKEEDEVYGEEATSSPKPPSRESAHGRKRSVIRSFRRPGWCGASRKAND